MTIRNLGFIARDYHLFLSFVICLLRSPILFHSNEATFVELEFLQSCIIFSLNKFLIKFDLLQSYNQNTWFSIAQAFGILNNLTEWLSTFDLTHHISQSAYFKNECEANIRTDIAHTLQRYAL